MVKEMKKGISEKDKKQAVDQLLKHANAAKADAEKVLKSHQLLLSDCERKKPARGQSSAHAQRVAIADLVPGNHGGEFFRRKGTAVNNAFTLFRRMHRRSKNPACQEEVAMLIGKAWRRKEMAQ